MKHLFWFLFVFNSSFINGLAVPKQSCIDLSKKDFDKEGYFPISGEWDFYWNQLLTPESLRKNGYVTELMPVPGSWNRQGKYPALGLATYRTQIRLPFDTHELAIYFPVINCAAKIWINGKLVGESGHVDLNNEFYRPRLNGTLVSVPAGQTELDLVIQVANFNYFIGGFSGTPRLGKISRLVPRLSQSQGIENFFAGSLVAMFVYQLTLFYFFKRGKSYLWLSLICLGVALRAMVVHGGSFLLPTLFPFIPWEIWTKIEFGCVYSIAAFFPLYIYNLFPNDAPGWPVKYFIAFSWIFCLIVLATPQFVYGQLLEIGHVVLLSSFIYAIYSVGKAWKNGNSDARTIFFGVIISMPFILTEILKNSLLYPLNIEFLYLVEIGVLIFLLFQVYLLANHYANSYRNIESLNQNLEKIVTERTGELITANRVKDRLLSIVSHDIKTPMNSLYGMLQLYNLRAIDENEFKDFSKRIEDDLSRTGLMIDNILHWTASQLKGLQLNFEELNLNSIAEKNIELFGTVSSNKKLSIRNEIDQAIEVIFDRNILDLTIRNLISNAIKFSYEGGEIVIHCSRDQKATSISIIDFGIGIKSEVLTSLKNFQSMESASGTSNEKGTGIGLSFCREYLSVAGGALEIDSTLGEGSTLTIVIPHRASIKKREENVQQC